MTRRVVVTGWGWLTPHGGDQQRVWEALTNARSGIRPLTRFDASRLPVRYAAEVPDVDALLRRQDLPADLSECSLQTVMAMAAAADAVGQAGLRDAGLDPRRVGVYLGCGELFQDFHQFVCSVAAGCKSEEDFDQAAFVAEALRRLPPDSETMLDPGATAARLAGWFDAQGPHYNCTSACASSSQAVGEACHLIRQGEAEVMLAGGAHSMIHPFGVTGFHRLGTLTTSPDGPRAMRPFDRDRSGFVIGEGAGIFVLEEESHARRRGAEIWAEISGYGTAQDAYRITDIHPDGKGAAACIRQALDTARVAPEDVSYVNAHGTSTVLNDAIETLAIKRAFGERAARAAWVSSSKSMLGHATTAGGAVEVGVCLMTLREGVIPPTANYETPDPACDLDYVPNAARRRRCRHVLSNSFGFGGQNVALVLSQYQPRGR